MQDVVAVTGDTASFDTQVTLAAVSTSAGQARLWLRQQIKHATRSSGHDLASDSLVVEVGELLVSEVVTNAVVHARSPAVLRARLSRGRLHVEVEDSSTDPPQHRTADPQHDVDTAEQTGVISDPSDPSDPDDLATSGRGLDLLDLLSASWGWRRTSTGKTVWFTVTDTSADAPAGT